MQFLIDAGQSRDGGVGMIIDPAELPAWIAGYPDLDLVATRFLRFNDLADYGGDW